MGTETLPMDPTAEAGALFSSYHDRIYRYVLSVIHDPSEAEDLTQETFLRAYAYRNSLRNPNAARGWLYRIATRVCLDALRQRVEHVSLDGEEGASAVDSAPSPHPSALEIAEREETGVCVQRCLDFLSDSYRAVILLHEGHSLTAAEIAHLLGESVGRSRSDFTAPVVSCRRSWQSDAPSRKAIMVCPVASRGLPKKPKNNCGNC